MKELDFSKFKKTSQDKNSATLKHPDGHEIKIAVSGLTSAMKKKLAGLPLHQEKAEEPVEAIEADLEPETPQEEVTPEPAPATPAPAAVSEAQAPEAPAEEPEAAQAPAPAQAGATTAPFNSDKARPPQTPLLLNQTPEEHYAQEVAFQNDLANRHIEPKTYKSLFADKSTLGKIGTIFGLMLSGAGSGLTHQPNALLDMMNKEIERDLEAQKQSKANANTFLSTQYAHDLQQAQALHMSNQNALTQQQLQESKAKTAGLEQANRAVNKRVVQGAGSKWDDSIEKQNALIGIEAGAKNKMLSTVAQHLDDVTPNNPLAKQIIQNTIKPAVDAQIQNNVMDTNAKRTANTALNVQKMQANNPAENANPDADIYDTNKYQKMVDSGKFNVDHGIPLDSKRDINPGDDAAIHAAVDKKRVTMNNYKDAADAIQEIIKMPNAGETRLSGLTQSLRSVPWVGESLYAAAQLAGGKLERPRDQLLDALGQRLMKNGESAASVEQLKQALAPSIFDTPETRAKIPELLHQHFNHTDNAHSAVLQKYGLDKPVKKIEMEFPKHYMSSLKE